MKIGRWQNNVKTLGPGNRVVLWVAGCSRSCPGCIGADLHSQEGVPDMDVRALAMMLNMLLALPGTEGLTISGGEPMEQAEDLCRLLEEVSADDVLLYSGWTLYEIKKHWAWSYLAGRIAALVPEPYIAELDHGSGLRGSDNQPVIVLKSQFQDRYTQAAQEERAVQLQQVNDGIVFTGIPPKELSAIILERRDPIDE